MNRMKTLFPQAPVSIQEKSYQEFAFYDYETDGIDKDHSQVTQFAAIKTDKNLNILESEIKNILVQPRIDSIPNVGAYKVTKIDVEQQKQEGITEFELSNEIFNFFSKNYGTSICGYNTIPFDDEITRRLMYRNQRDVYGHEWRDGNGRVDFYNLVKMAFAYKENSLNFPKIDGKTSLRLEKLSESNGIIHTNAHDALSDVEATISIAKMLKESEPMLFQYFLNLSDKRNAAALLDSGSAMLLTDNLFAQEDRLTTAIIPIYKDDTNNSKYICLDIRHDPSIILKNSKEEIKRLMFTKREELEEGADRIPVVSVTANKQPLIVRINEGNSKQYFPRFNLNRDELERNIKLINENLDEIIQKVKFAYGEFNNEKSDPYSQLYSGFIDKRDASIRSKCWQSTREKDARMIERMDVYKECLNAVDPVNMATLMLRAKWNNHYNEILMSGKYSRVEFGEWVKDLQKRLSKKLPGEDNTTISDFKEELAKEKTNPDLSDLDKLIIGKLETHVEQQMAEVRRLNEINRQNAPERKEELEKGSSFTIFKNRHMTNNIENSYDSSIKEF